MEITYSKADDIRGVMHMCRGSWVMVAIILPPPDTISYFGITNCRKLESTAVDKAPMA
jgi:hypothetical protein